MAIVFTAFVLGSLTSGPGRIPVTINGQPRVLRYGLTLRQIVGRLHLQPRSGDLLDVNGSVFRRDVYPGRILVDARVIEADSVLQPGYDLRVVDGRNRTERPVEIVRRIGRKADENPQFHLESIPGEETITVGQLSRAVVRALFRPLGPARPDNTVALTFDDGPSPYTQEILKILTHYHAHATFFVIGNQVSRYPHLVAEEIEAGMTVGNHSWSHPIRPLFAALDADRMRREIVEANEAIVAAGGPPPQLFRPPGGSLSKEVVRLSRELGMRVVMWSADPRDWTRGKSTAAIVGSVLGSVHPGSIVVLHDGGNNAAATVAGLPEIINGIRARGLHLVAIEP